MTNKEAIRVSALITEGLWRDGKLFVIDLRHHVFPNTCVKTNQEVGNRRTLITLNVWGAALEDFEEAKGLVVESSQMRVSTLETEDHRRASIPLMIPIVHDFHGLSRAKRGSRLAIVGVLIAILSFVAFVGTVVADSIFLPVAAMAFLAGLIITVVGGVMLSNRNVSVLEIKKLTMCMIWVDGANSDWLDSLPEFVAPAALLQRSYKNSRS